MSLKLVRRPAIVLIMEDNFSLALPLPGYYYDLDESYDESDEEEVKAHLRRVTEQPPLKLDTSSEVQKPHSQICFHHRCEALFFI